MTPYDWAVFAGALAVIGAVVFALRLPLARLVGRGQRGAKMAITETQAVYHEAAQDTDHEEASPHE